MKVFVDTNFFVAINNPSDSLNSKAQKLLKKIEGDNPRLVISNLVFAEIVTILSQRTGRDNALRIGGHLLEDDLVDIIHVDEDLQKRSWEIFKIVGQKNVSFVDCSILACIEEVNIQKLLTFDRQDFLKIRNKFGFSFYE